MKCPKLVFIISVILQSCSLISSSDTKSNTCDSLSFYTNSLIEIVDSLQSRIDSLEECGSIFLRPAIAPDNKRFSLALCNYYPRTLDVKFIGPIDNKYKNSSYWELSKVFQVHEHNSNEINLDSVPDLDKKIILGEVKLYCKDNNTYEMMPFFVDFSNYAQ